VPVLILDCCACPASWRWNPFCRAVCFMYPACLFPLPAQPTYPGNTVLPASFCPACLLVPLCRCIFLYVSSLLVCSGGGSSCSLPGDGVWWWGILLPFCLLLPWEVTMFYLHYSLLPACLCLYAVLVGMLVEEATGALGGSVYCLQVHFVPGACQVISGLHAWAGVPPGVPGGWACLPCRLFCLCSCWAAFLGVLYLQVGA
jgi:hypothetical protein